MSDLSRDLASLRIDRSAPARRSKWPLVLVGLVGLGGAAYVTRAYVVPRAQGALFKTEVEFTEVGSVSPSQAAVDVTATGYVVAQTIAKVGTEMTGRVKVSHVKEGQIVKHDELLFELETKTQDAQLKASQAEVGSAFARAQVAQANVKEIELQYERQKKLAKDGAVPMATVEDLEARLVALRSQAKAAEAESAVFATRAQALKVTLDQAKILAPMDGTISTRPAEVGDVVAPGTPLVEIVDMSGLLVEVDVPETRLAIVKIGGPCEIALDATGDKRFKGKVVELGPRLNRSKATAVVKVRFEVAPPELRPEMSARVSFLAEELTPEQLNAKPKITIPEAALVDHEGGKATYVLEGDKVRLVKLELGSPMPGGFEVKAGVTPGTRVVKKPPAALKDGQAVKEKDAS